MACAWVEAASVDGTCLYGKRRRALRAAGCGEAPRWPWARPDPGSILSRQSRARVPLMAAGCGAVAHSGVRGGALTLGSCQIRVMSGRRR